MAIKADKTFEEIVERLVALFQPQPETSNHDGRSTRASDSQKRPPTRDLRRSPFPDESTQ